MRPGGVRVLDPHDNQQPLTTSYSFTISQRLPAASSAEFSYVGNQAKYLNNASNGTFGNINALPYGTLFSAGNVSLFNPANGNTNATLSPNTTALQAYPQYGSILQQEHNTYSNYNAFQASWNKQSGHLNFLANYTFSKSLGIRGENTSSGVGDTTNIANNYGVLPNDRTHIFNLAWVYQMGELYQGNRLLKGVINGWQVSGTDQFQSGSPLQAIVSSNFNFGGYLAPGTVLPNGMTVPADNSLLWPHAGHHQRNAEHFRPAGTDLRPAHGPSQESVHQRQLFRGADSGPQRLTDHAVYQGTGFLQQRLIAVQELQAFGSEEDSIPGLRL